MPAGPARGIRRPPEPILTCKEPLAYRLSTVTDVFKALADPTRRTILDELSERDGQTLFELCARLSTKHGLASSRQAISQHLGALVADGMPFTTFAVEDVHAEHERLTGAGVRFTQEPAEMGPGVTTAVLDD